LIRGLLALLALVFAMACQYSLEQRERESLVGWFYMFLAAGLALTAAYFNRPFLPAYLD
jgi:hypothetical protein